MDIITVEQDKMIDLLLQGQTITSIANKLNIARSTVYAWKELSHVKAELEERREQLKKSAQNKITNDVCQYVENMKELANSASDARIRFQANKYLIDQCIGSPKAQTESKDTNDKLDNNKDTNTLKKELEDIKNLKVIK